MRKLALLVLMAVSLLPSGVFSSQQSFAAFGEGLPCPWYLGGDTHLYALPSGIDCMLITGLTARDQIILPPGGKVIYFADAVDTNSHRLELLEIGDYSHGVPVLRTNALVYLDGVFPVPNQTGIKPFQVGQ